MAGMPAAEAHNDFDAFQDAETTAKMYMLTCQSLQVQLGKLMPKFSLKLYTRNERIHICIYKSAERTEEASKAMAARRELQRRMDDISRDFNEEQKLTFEIRQDMTRQYKGMQEELLSRVSFILDMLDTCP